MIVVYTALFGDRRDSIRLPSVDARDGSRYVALTDLDIVPKPYTLQLPLPEVVAACRGDGRLLARWCKTHPHVLFPEADFTIWHDASFRLLRSPKLWLARELKDFDLASWKHRERDCLYEEISYVARVRYKDAALCAQLETQADRYRFLGVPAKGGLPETGCLLRRASEAVAHFNEVWWNEIRDYSSRDQVSFPYAAWATGLHRTFLPTPCNQSPWVAYHSHYAAPKKRAGVVPPARGRTLGRHRRTLRPR